jgi:hypothetical protein
MPEAALRSLVTAFQATAENFSAHTDAITDGLHALQEQQARQQKISRTITWVLIVDLILTVAVIVIAIVTFLSNSAVNAIHEQAQKNKETLAAVQAGNNFLRSCLDPKGECGRESAKANVGVVTGLQQNTAATVYCANNLKFVSTKELNDCVRIVLKTGKLPGR